MNTDNKYSKIKSAKSLNPRQSAIQTMKKYPKYKPSGVEWIGEIPEEWEVKKTKYCFKYTTGFTPPTGQNEYYNGDHIWITISDMNQKYLSDSSTRLSDEAIKKYKPDVTPKGSLLFSFKLSVGKVAFAGTDVYTNEAIISIIPNENINLYYFYYILPDQLLRNANENIYGAKLLNQELIKNASIIFPSLKDQTAIANFLDDKTAKIDTLIEKKKKLIELLKEERTAVINQAVTRGINPHVKLKESGIEWLDKIPAHWEVKKIKDICKIQGRIGYKGYKSSDLVPNGEGAITLGASHITRDHKLSLVQPVFLNWEKYFESPEIMVKRNDVVFTQRGAYLGKVAIIDRDYGEVTINPSLILLKQISVNGNFLKYFLVSNYIIANIEIISNNTAIPMISQEQLSNFYFLCPSNEEQEIISQYIETETKRIDETISKIEKEIELLAEYRTALISEVVTGKIKVTDT